MSHRDATLDDSASAMRHKPVCGDSSKLLLHERGIMPKIKNQWHYIATDLRRPTYLATLPLWNEYLRRIALVDLAAKRG